MKTTRLLALAAASLLLTAAHCQATFAIYLTTENPVIEGEATQKGYEKGWQLVGFSQDVKLPISEENGSRRVGQSQLSDVAVAKFLDKASALLLLRAAEGSPIGRVTISFVRQGGTQTLAYRVILENVVVSSVAQDLDDPSLVNPLTEEVKLNFRRITWTYYPYDATTGKTGTPVSTSWDLDQIK